jgi:hypothetical protein
MSYYMIHMKRRFNHCLKRRIDAEDSDLLENDHMELIVRGIGLE